MKNVFRAVLATAALATAATVATAQTEPPAAPAVVQDCSRWPASSYDPVSGTCLCNQGLWWNLRGDACLPKEHAAGEFCGMVWPGSQPLFTTGGGYRCVCLPPLLWDSQAVGCRAPMVDGEEDCLREWPGTLPVLSPSGTEFECRCPGGRRWDDARRTCVDGAPVVGVARGYFVPDGALAPGRGPSAPSEMPPAGAAPYEAPRGAPGEFPRGAMPTDEPPPRAWPQGAPPATLPQDDAGRPDTGAVDPRDARGALPPPNGDSAAPPASSDPKCEALLAEIRARAGAGQAAQADSLGMKAAIAGCDPKAIADAARVRKP